jgi:hypothetical protein
MLRRFVALLRSDWVWRYLVGPLPFVVMLAALVQKRFTFEHALIPGAMAVLYFLPQTKRAYPYLFPFFFFWVSYDTLRVLTPIFHSIIHPQVAWPYNLEHALFGIPFNGTRITLNEFFATHTHIAIDLVAAFAYAFYFYEPFIFAFWLLAKNRPVLRRYGVAFIVLNYIGFVTYYTLPAAPPWYVELYGLGPAIEGTPANAARLLAVDTFFNMSYFHDLYSRSANVFGALPSLHAAFPLLVWLVSRKSVKLTAVRAAMFAYWLLVVFSAVYLRHHYVIDVTLGSIYALTAWVITNKVADRWEHEPT